MFQSVLVADDTVFSSAFLSVDCKAVDNIIEGHGALDRARESKSACLVKFSSSFV